MDSTHLQERVEQLEAAVEALKTQALNAHRPLQQPAPMKSAHAPQFVAKQGFPVVLSEPDPSLYRSPTCNAQTLLGTVREALEIRAESSTVPAERRL